MIRSAPIARAATSAPSSTWYGLARRIARSLNEPGSPSAAFTTTADGNTGDRSDATVRHLRPAENPAPPRPPIPDASTTSITALASRSTASMASPPPAAR